MNKTLTGALTAALLCLGLASCSLFQKNVRTEAQLPSDRHTVENGASRKPYRSQALERGEIGGDWLIETVFGNKAKGQDTPYLKFEPKTHMVYGSNGCNTLNATYANNAADSTLTFNNMITTLRACPDEETSETAINEALGLTARYTWTLKEGRYSLFMYDAAGKQVLSLARQDFDFLNGTWRVAAIEGNKVNNDDMQLVLDVDEMKIHGNTGCNVLNGSIVTDMAEESSISFQDMATTRMTCPAINEEMVLLVALEATTKVRPVDNNTVEFLNAHGKVVLRLTREV